jgi:hypothetical protein
MPEIDGPGFWRCFAAWLAMLVASMLNGVLREFTYGKHLSELMAHQISTAIAVVLLGMMMLAFLTLYPPVSSRQALVIGLSWMSLTFAFEFLFFHFIGGRSWAELLANYDVLAGRVWIFVLIWLVLAPYLFFRLFAAA